MLHVHGEREMSAVRRACRQVPARLRSLGQVSVLHAHRGAQVRAAVHTRAHMRTPLAALLLRLPPQPRGRAVHRSCGHSVSRHTGR